MSLAAGDRVGPYEVIAQLGEGGMGVVDRVRGALIAGGLATPHQVVVNWEGLLKRK